MSKKQSVISNQWVAITLIFLAAILLRVPALFVPYYNIDELTNSIYANFIIDGDMNLEDFLGNTYILTHYIYVWIYQIFGKYNLNAIHMVHAVYVGITAIILYLSGKKLTNNHESGLIAGLGYAVFSVCFLSKDFQSALAESFSLLPSSLAALCFISAFTSQKKILYFLTGLFIGIAALCKAPAGIMILPVGIILLFNRIHWFRNCLLSGTGLIVGLLIPVLFYGDIIEGFFALKTNLFDINQGYIRSYQDLSFFYWFSKLCLRTMLVSLSVLPLFYFAISALKHLKSSSKPLLIIFLILWLLCCWLVVSLGKRVFYHYFVFLFPALCLLAAWGWDQIKPLQFGFRHFIKQKKYKFLTLAGILSLIIFVSDGFLRFSLNYNDLPQVISKIKTLTDEDDTIYVWGLIPQIYFFSQRQPASTMIWADTLAGFSTGSPAMEFMRSSGKTLSLPEAMLKDLNKNEIKTKKIKPIHKNQNPNFNEHELFYFKELYSYYEILNHVDNLKWRKVLEDFAQNPPKLILDTSPTNIRHFSNYPIHKYELLKKFVEENYNYYGSVEGVMFYKLK